METYAPLRRHPKTAHPLQKHEPRTWFRCLSCGQRLAPVVDVAGRRTLFMNRRVFVRKVTVQCVFCGQIRTFLTPCPE